MEEHGDSVSMTQDPCASAWFGHLKDLTTLTYNPIMLTIHWQGSENVIAMLCMVWPLSTLSLTAAFAITIRVVTQYFQCTTIPRYTKLPFIQFLDVKQEALVQVIIKFAEWEGKNSECDQGALPKTSSPVSSHAVNEQVHPHFCRKLWPGLNSRTAAISAWRRTCWSDGLVKNKTANWFRSLYIHRKASVASLIYRNIQHILTRSRNKPSAN